MRILFFELLRVAVGTKDSLSRIPDQHEWQALFNMACMHAIAGVCADGISRLPEEQRPPKDIAMRWVMMTVGIENRNRKLNRQAVEVQAKFGRAGFRSCILKGQGVAMYYPEPLHRQSGDIDIWLEGGRRRIVSYVRGISSQEIVSYHHIDFKIIKEPSVEVHFFPSYLTNPLFNCRMQDYWESETDRQMENRVKLPNGCGCITAPTDDCNVIVLLAHIHHHYFEEGIGLRQIMDLYYVLSKGLDESDIIKIRHRLCRFHIIKFTGALMYVLQYVFGMNDVFLLLPPHEKAGRMLLRHIMEAGNFGHYDKRVGYIYKTKSPLLRFIRRGCFNMRMVLQYPGEYVSNLYFRVYYYFYRKKWNVSI